MAFIVSLQDGELVNYTEIYPHGMTHPNASEPQEAQEQGAGEKFYFTIHSGTMILKNPCS